MTATPMEIDFSKVKMKEQRPSRVVRDISQDRRPTTKDGKLLTPKQIRARARRRMARGASNKKGAITKEEFEALYKPIEEWDLEELAKGRPRDSRGGFGGRTPGWITREVHEKAMARFTEVIKSRMGEQSITALETIADILTNQDRDERGKPIVPASTKAQVAITMLEHTVGKPKQHVQQDISVKLQAILGSVMVNPAEALAPPSQGGKFGDEAEDRPGYELAHFPGQTMPLGPEVEEDEDIVEGEIIDG